jgi:hypothetical protein
MVMLILAVSSLAASFLAQARDYDEVVVTDDIFSLKDIPLRRDEQKARNVSIAASDEMLRDDCASGDGCDKRGRINPCEKRYCSRPRASSRHL